ncbi:DUF4031 domain-containing protein [Rubrivivax gelatinosus]|uniref:DUF4031 domain-containing protein n=1 Tax=Rubrivivax gelatinosus (strain NBRC 100245 / IL144) TaxID=983917 RepID=I0HTJ8_RUBGI|nr:DUF4031 domain-containing protein [Rubrivivax gelatinosus]BAL96335.1 hypothetical protein RGE_29960 [Rubrivivax gelatinosus IL144]
MVYIDDAEVAKHGRNWFHLTADRLDELHSFAACIGLPANAFHRGARHPHYDVTAAQRLRALRGGARAVSSREVVRIARIVRASARAAATSDKQLTLFE